ncbi:MAG: LptE family protein [Acidobacteria bacterium]|nr:LptE family protein [Acidobacteriota bacterium]
MVRGLRAAARGIAVALALAAAPACGYRLAGHNQLLPPSVKTIGILPFGNETRRAEVDQRITEQVTQTFISRGGYRTVSTAEGADAVLKGQVTGYDVNPVNVGRDGRATVYEVIVSANVELKDASSEKVYFRSDHFVFKRQYGVSRSATQFIDAEIVAINEVAHDFAESVVTSILEGF